MLCSVDVAVIIFGNNKKLYEYSSGDVGEILTRYQYVRAFLPNSSAPGAKEIWLTWEVFTVWPPKRTQRPARL